MKRLTFLLVLMALMASCGRVTYLDDAFASKACHHKVVAVIPFEVDILYNPITGKGVTPEMIAEMESNLSVQLQEGFYSQFLRQHKYRDYTVKLQDPRRTNLLLEEKGIDPATAWKRPPEELARVLGVDGVIIGYVQMEKPLPEVMAAAVAVLFNTWLPTNEVSARLSLYEGQEGELLWRFERRLSGSVTSSVESLMRALVRAAARKFPYQETYL